MNEYGSDPSESGIPPDLATIELALRVAERQCNGEFPGSYWHGAAEALRWALGLRDMAPVSQEQQAADLHTPRRPVLRSEAEIAYEYMTGARRGDFGMRYLTGVENTCMWIVAGRGFAQTLDRDWLRQYLDLE